MTVAIPHTTNDMWHAYRKAEPGGLSIRSPDRLCPGSSTLGGPHSSLQAVARRGPAFQRRPQPRLDDRLNNVAYDLHCKGMVRSLWSTLPTSNPRLRQRWPHLWHTPLLLNEFGHHVTAFRAGQGRKPLHDASRTAQARSNRATGVQGDEATGIPALARQEPDDQWHAWQRGRRCGKNTCRAQCRHSMRPEVDSCRRRTGRVVYCRRNNKLEHPFLLSGQANFVGFFLSVRQDERRFVSPERASSRFC